MSRGRHGSSLNVPLNVSNVLVKCRMENMNKQQTRSVFLSDTELKRMTGFKDCKKQVEWLEQNGFAPLLNGNGVPIMTRQYIESHFARLVA